MSNLITTTTDMAALGQAAKAIGPSNPILSAMLFKLLGLMCVLSTSLSKAFSTRKLDPVRATKSMDLYLHIIWLSREGLSMTQDFVIPMAEGVPLYPNQRRRRREDIDPEMAALKVVCWKLKADFLYIFCLFHNTPAVTRVMTPPKMKSSRNKSVDKGKGKAVDVDNVSSPASPGIDRANTFTPGQMSSSSVQPSHPLEYGIQCPMSPSQSFEAYQQSRMPASSAAFLLPLKNYIPQTLLAFEEVNELCENVLWGSHPVRLSVKVSFANFLHDCCGAAIIPDNQILWHGRGKDGQTLARELCWRAIKEVYEAEEPVDDEMFEDAARLVGVLGRMGKRGSRRDSLGTISSINLSKAHARSRSGTPAGLKTHASWHSEDKENREAYSRTSGVWFSDAEAKNSEKSKQKVSNELQSGAERKFRLIDQYSQGSTTARSSRSPVAPVPGPKSSDRKPKLSQDRRRDYSDNMI